jgi:UDP-N-acetylglucosamine 2-epimerase (non-hydrolysing)
MQKKILIVFGTRPEAIKMAVLIKEFSKYPDYFKVKVCVSAQHREMLDQVLDFFKIQPDYDLNLMQPNQNLYSLTAIIIESLKPILEEFAPEYIFVHGDTTTTMASSIAGFYSGAKVCHIEAGLRTNNKLSPFPEEINRQIVGRISDYHFAPTIASKKNLLKENIDSESIIVTGNTVIDALFEGIEIIKHKERSRQIESICSNLSLNQEVILVTGHRRENHGVGFENICAALKEIAIRKPEVIIIYPVHLNPKVQEPVKRHLQGLSNVLLTEPLAYPDFIWLMDRSKIIITDSGGVQEEAPSLGKPVLVLRENTERPEAVEAGTVILVGTDKARIINETIKLLDDKNHYRIMSELLNPYGDGKACEKIVNFFIKYN